MVHGVEEKDPLIKSQGGVEVWLTCLWKQNSSQPVHSLVSSVVLVKELSLQLTDTRLFLIGLWARCSISTST